jgi:imidazolonepropionase-like amidohydrolase
MIRVASLISIAVVWSTVAAQDLTVVNGRIVDGTGQVLDNGGVLIQAGRIVDVFEGEPTSLSGVVIDAGGMTVMPGLIDTHRHLTAYDIGRWYAENEDPMSDLDGLVDRDIAPVLHRLLEKGITTVMSPGDLPEAILEIRRRVNAGELRGPRLFVVGPTITSPNDWPVRLCRGNANCRSAFAIELDDPMIAEQRIGELATTGVDAVKIIFDSEIEPDVILREDVAAAVATEARRHGLVTHAHVGSVDEMLTAVRSGARRLVHTPNHGSAAEFSAGQPLRDADVAVSTTVSWQSAAIQEAMGRERTQEQEATLNQVLANVRYLWDEGIVMAFGTDNPIPLDKAEFMVEVHELSKVLSHEEIISALTRNAAVYLGQTDDLGTLETGKIADILIVNGDPLRDISDLENVELVVQAGRIVVDNR